MKLNYKWIRGKGPSEYDGVTLFRGVEHYTDITISPDELVVWGKVTASPVNGEPVYAATLIVRRLYDLDYKSILGSSAYSTNAGYVHTESYNEYEVAKHRVERRLELFIERVLKIKSQIDGFILSLEGTQNVG